jgi:hypothetical protein
LSFVLLGEDKHRANTTDLPLHNMAIPRTISAIAIVDYRQETFADKVHRLFASLCRMGCWESSFDKQHHRRGTRKG